MSPGSSGLTRRPLGNNGVLFRAALEGLSFLSPHPQLTMPGPPLCCTAEFPCSTSTNLDVSPLSFSPVQPRLDLRVKVLRELALVLGPTPRTRGISGIVRLADKLSIGRGSGR